MRSMMAKCGVLSRKASTTMNACDYSLRIPATHLQAIMQLPNEVIMTMALTAIANGGNGPSMPGTAEKEKH